MYGIPVFEVPVLQTPITRDCKTGTPEFEKKKKQKQKQKQKNKKQKQKTKKKKKKNRGNLVFLLCRPRRIGFLFVRQRCQHF